MFWEKPDISRGSFYVEPTDIDNPATLSEQFFAARKDMHATGQLASGRDNLAKVYSDHIARVKELTGKDLWNPETFGIDRDPEMRDRYWSDWNTYQKEGGTLSGTTYRRIWQEQEFRRQLEAIANERPDLRSQLLPETSFRSQGIKSAIEARQKSADVWQQSQQRPIDYMASFGGMVVGGLEDPVNVLTLPFGFGGVGKGMQGILMGGLKAGTANALVEAGVQPFIKSYNERVGLPYGWGDAALGVGSAFAFGAGVDMTVRGAYRGLAGQFGYAPIVKDGVVVAWRKGRGLDLSADVMPSLPNIPKEIEERANAGDATAQAEVARILDEHAKTTGETVIPHATMEKAAQGDPDALRKVYEPMANDDPVIRQALDTAEADTILTAKPSDLVDDATHAVTLTQALRHANEPDAEPLPVRIDVDPPVEGVRPKIEKELQALREQVAKGQGNEDIAARVAELEGQIRAIDTFGSNPIADAQVIRDNGGKITADVDAGSAGVRKARALASLSDEAFDMVKSGQAPQDLGVMVADFSIDPATHARLLTDVMARNPAGPDDARAMIADLLQSPDYAPKVEVPAGPVADAAGSPRLMDDPTGPEAKAQVARLEQQLAEELGGGRPDPVEILKTPEGQAAAIARAGGAQSAIADLVGIVPEDVNVIVFSAIDDLPQDIRAQVRAGNAATYAAALKRFQSATSRNERARARATMDAASKGQGIEGIARDSTIYLASYAMDPKGRLAHEAVHALKTTGRLAPEEVTLLARAAREAGIWTDQLEATYRGDLEARMSPDRVRETLEEEASAHYVEAVARGEVVARTEATSIIERLKALFRKIKAALVGQGFVADATDPAQDVAAAILAGHVARREQNAEWMRVLPDELPGSKINIDDVSGLGDRMIADIADAAQSIRDDLMEIVGATPALQRDADGSVSSVRWGGQTYAVTRDADGNISSVSRVPDQTGGSYDISSVGGPAFERITETVGELISRTSANPPDPAATAEIVQRVVSGVAGGEDVQTAISKEIAGRHAAAPMNSPEDRYINRMRAGGSQKTDAELRAQYQKQIARMRGDEDGEAKFAMRDTDTGRSMRADLDRLGYFSGALEAAKRLRQAKGTPEQMLAMLQKEGAKKAEIEATNLAQLFEGKSRPLVEAQNGTRIKDVSVHDHYRGESFGEKVMERDGKPIAVIDLSVTADRIWVRNITSIEGRKGNATALVDDLFREFPDRKITISDMTDDGAKFFRKKYDLLPEGEIKPKTEQITKQEIIDYLEANRVDVREVQRVRPFDKPGVYPPVRHVPDGFEEAKWSPYSLDPNNPTYRETVLHLPPTASEADMDALRASADRGEITSEQFRARRAELEQAALQDFRSGHFPEPNIVGHMMTSMVEHEGKPTFLVDQIQSDWGQKLRDGGVRDEAKIAELKKQIQLAEKRRSDAAAEAAELIRKSDPAFESYDPAYIGAALTHAVSESKDDVFRNDGRLVLNKLRVAMEGRNLREAELRTAEAATPGHPLVNTTDQWTTTTLRRAIRQAAEADAEYIAIPHGDTVLSYNPGDTDGMRGFYGSRNSAGIVTKNLKNLLKKIDKQSPDPVVIDELETPTSGMKGNGFTLFKLTDKVKQSVKEQGQPLFAMRSDLDMSPEARKQRADEWRHPKGQTEAGRTYSALTLYHGTDATFDAFRGTTWLSTESDVASVYAVDRTGGKTHIRDLPPDMPVKARDALVRNGVSENQAERIVNEYYQTAGPSDAAIDLVSRLSDADRQAFDAISMPPVDHGPKVLPVYARLKNPKVVDAMNNQPGDFIDLDWEIKQAKQAGHDALVIKNFNDLGSNKPQTQIAVFDPANIRSVNAAFDPAKADSPNLMYAMRNDNGRMKPGALERAEAIQTDLAEIEAALKGAQIDEREALQRKRASLLNGKAHEVGLDDAYAYRTPRGEQDPAMGFLRLHETFGQGGAMDVVKMKDDIQNQAMQKMADVVWELRKGAISGDARRHMGQTKTLMENVIREASGQSTKDPLAARLAKAWIETAEWLRQSFNAAGGDIGKLKGWFAPQHHDAEALLRAGRDKWASYVLPLLDRERMTRADGAPLTNAELRSVLEDIWVTITTDGANTREVTGHRGKGALYKRHAEHRVLHFKDADAFLKYAKDFGSADPYAMMIGHINMMARDIAAMRRFGANPEVVRERIKQQIQIDAQMQRSAKSMFDDLSDMVRELQAQVRSIKTPADAALARIAKIHTELDKVRGKPKRMERRLELDAELGKAHDDLRDALTSGSLTPEQTALVQRIGDLTEEMAYLNDNFSVMSRNPVERVNRILLKADEIWKLYSGSTNTPVDSRWAAFTQGARNIVSSSTLPFASISAISDQATSLAARSFIGMPVTTQLSSFVKAFTPEDRKFALRAGLGLDQGMNAYAVQSRFAGWVNTRSVTGYLADRTHALSLLSPMTQAAKVAFGSDFMAWMADLASTTAFKDLLRATRDMWLRHGLTEADWVTLRTVKPETHRGVPVMTRAAIEASAGPELAEKFMVMLLRERAQAVLEPTLEGRALFISESRPGSLMGEITRSIAMLKSFPTTYMMLVLGRAYNDMVAQGGLRGNNAAYLAALLFGGTMLGAMAKQMKHVSQGRDPEDMRTTKFWGGAFMQAGGLGIYGDFIFNSTNRYGNGLAQTLMGPMADRATNVLNLTFGNVIQYAQDEKTNFGREAVQFMRMNTPVWPFYLRQAYERLILDELQKKVDPEAHKSFRSRINNIKKVYGNKYYWPPGSTEPRAPNFNAAFGGRQ